MASCDIINPEEPIPALINMETIDLVTTPGQGTDRHKITEVWLFDPANFLGAFSAPTEIPIYSGSETTTYTFQAGIRNNGILDDAIVYPMYSPFVATLNTSPEAISVVNPVFTYRPEVRISLNADFEISNEFVDNIDFDSFTQVTRSDIEPFEGQFSGEIFLSAQADTLEVTHALALVDLPTDGTPVYLEFHYRSEAAMEIGLLGIPLNNQSFSNYFYLVKPSDTWNKIYLELTDWLVVSGLPAYKILFKSEYPSNATKPEVKIQLDNIKVVHL
jgi:hypothetical protein